MGTFQACEDGAGPRPGDCAMRVGRVLIVDDYPPTVAVIEEALVEAGFVVLKASNGAEALVLAETEAPDVVVLDLAMPGPHGLQVLPALRALPAPRRPRVVILTALSGDHLRLEAEVRGAELYLTKPCPMEDVVAAVRKLLGLPEA